MAIRTVVTRGYGNGTFNGTISLVVTRGYSIATPSVIPTGVPLTTDITQTTITENTTSLLVDGIMKTLSLIGCKNIYPRDIPPIVNEQQFRDLLSLPEQDVSSLTIERLEGWFVGRKEVRTLSTPQNLATNVNYQQLHGIRVVAYVWHRDLESSWRYTQSKCDELLLTLHKNVDLTLGSSSDLTMNILCEFDFDNFAGHGLYRGEINFDLLSTMTEASPRITTFS